MNQSDQIKLAIECGVLFDKYGDIVNMDVDQLAAYTAAVEAPLQARIAQLEEFVRDCVAARGITINGSDMAFDAQRVLSQFPDTWLSEHDKEVESRERERCALLCDGMHIALSGECATAIRSLK